MMRRSIFFTAVSICLLQSVAAQVQWPAITQTARPWTRWWWQGSAVDKQNLTMAMQQYRDAGLGGLEITPIYGIKGHEDKFIDFLSPRWMDMLQHTLFEGRRLGLGIDLANATGWPFGGPWIKPADASRNANLKTYSLKEGQRLNERIRFTQQPFYRSESRAKLEVKDLSYPIATNKNLQAYAFDQVRYEMELKPAIVMTYNENGESIDISTRVDATGKLDWTAPAGNWKIVALFTGWHGKMVERAAPGGEGDVIDHFDGMALQHYLQRFDSAFKGRDISGIRSFFNDSYEVDDARGQANWTPGLLNEFRLRRGYALEKYLLQLFTRDSTDTGRRVLADYRQTISDLLLDNFTKPWYKWAATKNKMVRNQSHGSPANILDLYAVVDIPETEGADILRFKFATSTANITGKPLAAAEAATWLNEHFQSSLGDVKRSVDKYFVGGVNHIVWHGTNYSPQNEPWPGWLFYAAVHFTPANPFWKDFSVLNNYVARCQSFLQKGKPDNDILLYFPFNDRIAEMGRDLLLHFDGMEGFDRTTFKTSAEWLLQKGYAFDLVSDKQVQATRNRNAFLQTGGVQYKTIVLSNVGYLPLETLSRLTDAARQGSTIIFYKKLPSDVPGLAGLQQRRDRFNKIISGLVFTNSLTPTVKKAIIGKGAFLLGDDLGQLLTEAKTMRETLVDQGLQYTRRAYSVGHYYFISNAGNAAINKWVPLQVKEKNIVLFDPMTLSAGIAKTRTVDGAIEVLLQLQPGESCVLQTSRDVVKGNTYPYHSLTGKAYTLDGTWQLQFISGGPVLPPMADLRELRSWTELAGDAVKNFSGTARYSTRFPLPAFQAEKYLLDLGNVAETAEIILNGKKLATILGPVYQVIIPQGLLKADNLLELNITNSMANRIADLDRRGIVWKKFYNTNFPSRLPQNRGTDGIFTAAAWQPKASGLIGPVKIYGVRMDK